MLQAFSRRHPKFRLEIAWKGIYIIESMSIIVRREHQAFFRRELE